MKTFECREGGLACGFTARGKSDEEVMAKAVAHATRSHGVDLTQAATLERYAHSLIRDERERAADAR